MEYEVELYKSLFEKAKIPIFIVDSQTGKILHVNQQACKLYEYTTEEFTQLTTFDLAALEPEEIKRLMMKVQEQKLSFFESIHKKKCGEKFPVEVYPNPIKYKDTVISLVFIHDISKRRTEEKKKRQLNIVNKNSTLQKIEAIGYLAGGLAHDFRNILQGISGNVELLNMSNTIKDKDKKYIQNIIQGVNRGTELTTRLLTFAKGGQPKLINVNLKKVVEDAFALIQSSTPNVKFIFNLDPKIELAIDVSQITRVINNIAINGIQAMVDNPLCEKCTLEISTCITEKINKQYACICIKDYGKGIPREIQPKIFSPYFTTKKNGTGIGLATAYSIIRAHEGIIEFDSVPNLTEFRVYLPLDRKGIDTLHHNDDVEVNFNFRGINILLLDDELPIHSILQEYLSKYGINIYSVFTAADALQKCRDTIPKEKIDIAIIDLIIPGDIEGTETINRLHTIAPKLPIIVISGYSEEPILTHPKRYGVNGVLEKPFKLSTLLQMINHVLKQTQR